MDGYIGPHYEQLVQDIDRAIPERDRLSGNIRVIVNRTLRLMFERCESEALYREIVQARLRARLKAE